MNINSTVLLDNGVDIPILGFGTYQSKAGNETQNAVRLALDYGYRHIDTAAIYGNENDVAKAIQDSKVDLNDLFITTKVWNADQGYDNTLKALDQSLLKLNMDYVDMYLVHWPQPGLRLDTWKAMMTIYEQGKARAIGISNYTEKHIDELLIDSPIVPGVNQIEMTPYLYQKELAEHCLKNRIQIESYSPLTQGKKINEPRLVALANKYGKTAGQMLIRWSIEHNFIVLPKSATAERIKENAEVFDFSITKEDLDFMDSWDENFRVSWNPYNLQE
jgi:diketogulonate reductase-like aldo/keto reductase